MFHASKSRWLVALAGVALCSLAAPASAGAATHIVFLKKGVDAKAHAASYGLSPDVYYSTVANGYAATVAGETLTALASDQRVTQVETDDTTATPSEPVVAETVEQPPQRVSNGVRRIGGLESRTARIDGKDQRIDVDVAVLDTGIQPDHPDLNVAGGRNCVPREDGWHDVDGHGTMVAGFVGAIDNRIGRVGVAPGARVWSARVLDAKGFGQESWIICGLDWVAANAGMIEIANLSLSGPHPSANAPCGTTKPRPPAVHVAVCEVLARGVTVVASAGNEAKDANRLGPANIPGVITVSALADADGLPGGLFGPFSCVPGQVDDTFATFSNYGSVVDIAAPGTCIASTTIGSSYATASGTSFAAPLVAGAAALYLSKNRGASPAAVRGALLRLVEPGPIPGDPDAFPEGVVNVSKL